MTSKRPLACIALVLCAAGADAQVRTSPPSDTVYFNANIHTVDPARPRASAIAIAGARIASIGSDAEVLATADTNTRKIDLHGATVVPGLIDAHGHMASLGRLLTDSLDLRGVPSLADLAKRAAERAATLPKGDWVLGRNWDHELWPQRALPTHAPLSAAVPDHPVWLQRVDGHAALANAAAMKLAGITRDTPSPAGGEILHDAHGEPTGVFIDAAQSLIRAVVKPTPIDAADLLARAQQACLEVGLTGVHDMGVAPVDIDSYRAMNASGRLKMRISVMVAGPFALRYFTDHKPEMGDRLCIRGAKLYMDGALGSRGAWLLAPYADRATDDQGKPYTGLAVSETDFIQSVAEHALAKGYQVCTHAIGDRANREVLNAYGRALGKAGLPPAAADHRFRIEHAQVLAADDIPRFAHLGVIASMQPTHCTTDMRWIEARIGPDRAAGAYAWSSLRKAGARLAAGSDFPVEQHNPFLGLYSAVTRQDPQAQPPGGWHPDQRMTREEALRAFTLDAAYAAFREKDLGSLEPGKFADFIVLDRDILTCPPLDIAATRVTRTVIAGEAVYERAATGAK